MNSNINILQLIQFCFKFLLSFRLYDVDQTSTVTTLMSIRKSSYFYFFERECTRILSRARLEVSTVYEAV